MNLLGKRSMIRKKEHYTKGTNRTGDNDAHMEHLEEGRDLQIQSAWNTDVCVECVGTGNMEEEKWGFLL